MTRRCICWCMTWLLLSTLAMAEDKEGKSIFNGKDLSGWKGSKKLWSVEDGAITGRTTAEDPLQFNTFLVWDEGTVSDFELHLDYRIAPEDQDNAGGNSGIQYRSRLIDEEKYIVGGYQADIDLSMTYAGINYEERGRGILAQRGQRVTIGEDGEKQVEQFGEAEALGKKIDGEGWNHYRIVVKGPKLSHYINGELMSEVIDYQSDKSAAEGILAFQIHQGPPMLIQFKNIKLKDLSKEAQ